MRRRSLLALASGTALGGLLAARWKPAAAGTARAADIAALQAGWRELLADGAQVAEPAPALEIAKEEWRKRLGGPHYAVLFEEDTERPFSSPLNEEKRPGVYVCAACSLPLFTSAMKFDSGTGWPSFFTSIPGHLGTRNDYSLIWPRTEYHCIKCGGHQGHVFDDGPPPTGERWCNNGVALRFIPRA